MSEILGLGMTHFPLLIGADKDMARVLRSVLEDPGLPARCRDPKNWPAPMRDEYGTDGGAASAAAHREALVGHFRKLRTILDEFRPDVVIVWGDDQYENFKEDIIPPFCVLAYNEIEARHRAHDARSNVWGEGPDTVFRIRGHREAAKFLASSMLEQGIDLAYAYKPLHYPGLAHAFLNSVLFLDYDRSGFPYRIVPFQVNCYGRRVVAQRGFRSSLTQPLKETDLDPPSPTPERCMAVGAAAARAMRESPWRTAFIASSGWSHAFLVDKNHHLYPDVESDRRMYEALRGGDYETWRRTPLSAIEASGQQEMLNWFMLVGAMKELGRTPDECHLVESWAFNSNKCFAVFKP